MARQTKLDARTIIIGLILLLAAILRFYRQARMHR
jgi:hypothetical protein